MKRTIAFIIIIMIGHLFAQAKQQEISKKGDEVETTEIKNLYTFELSDNVTRQKVTFKNRYGITLTGDLYLPKNHNNEPLAALAISGPFGAVKE